MISHKRKDQKTKITANKLNTTLLQLLLHMGIAIRKTIRTPYCLALS